MGMDKHRPAMEPIVPIPRVVHPRAPSPPVLVQPRAPSTEPVAPPIFACASPSRRTLGLTLRTAELQSLEEIIMTPASSAAQCTPIFRRDPSADTAFVSESEEPKRPRRPINISEVVASPKFNFVMGVLIVTNMALMSIELDSHPMAGASEVMLTFLRYPDVPAWVFHAFEIFFFVVFGFELAARCAALRWAALRDPSTYIDGLALLPLVLQLVFDLQSGKHLMALRVVRLIKLCRVFRLIRVFKELQLIAKSFITALRTLVWIGLLLMMFVYCCAIVCTMLVGQNPEYNPDNDRMRDYEAAFGDEVQIARHWGSIMRSVFTLFQIFTLDGWSDVVRPIVETHQPVMFFFFVTFIFLTSFGLLNLLMGAIVDHTLSVAHESELERERILQEEYKHVMLAAARLFSYIDEDGNGTLSMAEIDSFLNKNDIKNILEKDMESLHLRIDYEELTDVFRVVVEHWRHEADDNGICLEEFVGAAMRLHGPAKSQDLLSTLFTAKSAINRIEAVDASLKNLHARMGVQEKMVSEGFKQIRDLLSGTADGHANARSSWPTQETLGVVDDGEHKYPYTMECRPPPVAPDLSGGRRSTEHQNPPQQGQSEGEVFPPPPHMARQVHQRTRSHSVPPVPSSTPDTAPAKIAATSFSPDTSTVALSSEREALKRCATRRMTATLKSMCMDDVYGNSEAAAILKNYKHGNAAQKVDSPRPPRAPRNAALRDDEEVPSPVSPRLSIKSWFKRSPRPSVTITSGASSDHEKSSTEEAARRQADANTPPRMSVGAAVAMYRSQLDYAGAPVEAGAAGDDDIEVFDEQGNMEVLPNAVTG